MIINPYLSNGIWLKGNLHTHTENSNCGHYSLDTVINMYTSVKMNYDFLAITDHYIITNLEDRNDKDIILFSGVELKRKDYQTLAINIKEFSDDKETFDNHQQIFDEVNSLGGLNIICHPHVFEDNYWPFEKLIALDGYIGIEIYNNNVKFDNKGRALSTDLWDKLLSNGKKVFGFANDDMHVFQRCGGAYNMALCSDKSPSSILTSLKGGSFYATTGISIKSINIDDESYKVELTHPNLPVTFKFIGNNGTILKECFGSAASYSFNGEEKYVRVEMHREDGPMAWTQPAWVL